MRSLHHIRIPLGSALAFGLLKAVEEVGQDLRRGLSKEFWGKGKRVFLIHDRDDMLNPSFTSRENLCSSQQLPERFPSKHPQKAPLSKDCTNPITSPIPPQLREARERQPDKTWEVPKHQHATLGDRCGEFVIIVGKHGILVFYILKL